MANLAQQGLVKVDADETRMTVHAVVRDAYQLTEDEVQVLWSEWKHRHKVEIDESKEVDGPTVGIYASLYQKFAIKEKDGPIGKYFDGGDHSTAIRTYRRKRLAEFASWLFTGEPIEIPLIVPNVVQCAPFPDGCSRVFDKAMFPFWPTEPRCSLCIQRSTSPTHGSRRRGLAVKKLHEMLSLGKSKKVDAEMDRFSRVFSRFVKKEGDIEGIAEHWHQWFEYMRGDESKRMSSTLGQAYLSIMKIWLELDKHRDSQVNLEDMDDEELKDFIVQHTLSKLTKEQREKFIESAYDEASGFLEDGLEEEIYAETKAARR